MELKNNGKINFILNLFLTLKKAMSGGNLAMHRLAYKLAESGHNVYIFCEPEFPHNNITVIPSKVNIISGHKFTATWEGFGYNQNNTVTITPEHGGPNVFNTNNTVRWIMYHTTKQQESTFKDSEYIFNYGNFKTYLNREDGKLRIIDYNIDVFVNNNKKREGYCHILSKNTPKDYENKIKNFNSTNITHLKDDKNLTRLCDEFNKFEYFLTFDQKTYLTTAAALCGCKVIILDPHNRKNENLWEVDGDSLNAYTNSEDYNYLLSPLEYKIENPTNLFGVAYGVDDLPWAENTIHLVKKYLEEMENIDNKNFQKFIKFWEKKLQINNND
jgi:hypothetical protein